MELKLDQALQKGVEAHKAGKVQEADRYYTAILKAKPKHPDANHNMGVLAVGIGKVEEALPFFKTALEVNQTIGQYWLSYINTLIKLDRMDDAKAAFTQAQSHGVQGDGLDKVEKSLVGLEKGSEGIVATSKTQEPPDDQFQSLINLFTLSKYQEALNKASRLLKEFPKSINLYNTIGAANKGLGRLEEAIEAYKKALSIKPDYADAYYNMGVTLQEQGKLKEAIEAYKKALSIKPDYAEAYNNMGNALKEEGRFTEELKAYKKALSIKPDYAEVYNNMGNALRGQGKMEEAIEAYTKAISIKPDRAEVYNNMGNAFTDEGNLGKAIEAYTKALSLKPDYAEAYNNMGIALKDQSKLKRAIDAYKKSISIKPDFAEAYWNLSGTAENIRESKKWVGKCLNADPEYLEAKVTLSALQFYEGDKSNFNALMKSSLKDNAYMRSLAWAFSLPQLPPLHFHRWAFFDHMIALSEKDRPFYEFGVWRAEAFRYLIKTFKKGFGFDTFQGLPEDWHNEKAGTYSSDGNVPKIKGGKFIVGKFEDTLPDFFAKKRPMASIINFDADLYSSTICALNFAKPVIDRHTILIFDEFIINKNWEQDEYKALEEFCVNNDYTYQVLANSFFTKQVAVKIVGI